MPGTVRLELDGILLDEFKYRDKSDRTDWMHRKRNKKCYQGEAKQKMYFTIIPDETPRKHHSTGDIDWLKKLISDQYTLNEIAEIMDISLMSAHRWVKHYKLPKPRKNPIIRPIDYSNPQYV